jgi:PAS domain-containing protein
MWAVIDRPYSPFVVSNGFFSSLLENPTLQITYRIIHPDGTVIWLEQNSRAYFDEQGTIKRIVGMVVDVTERRKAEDRLREYERAVEGSEDMIAVVDREYRYLIANRQFLKMRKMMGGTSCRAFRPRGIERGRF